MVQMSTVCKVLHAIIVSKLRSPQGLLFWNNRPGLGCLKNKIQSKKNHPYVLLQCEINSPVLRHYFSLLSKYEKKLALSAIPVPHSCQPVLPDSCVCVKMCLYHYFEA